MANPLSTAKQGRSLLGDSRGQSLFCSSPFPASTGGARWTAVLILLAAVGALAFRLPRLDLRPLHTDEAVHAAKTGIVLETGRYVYDLTEYHGPTPHYSALPFIWLGGARTFAETSEVMYRIVPVVYGVALVLLLLGMIDGLGRPAAVCAAILTAVSPAMVFYSRYYIQEMPYICFTFAAVVCAWRYTRSRRLAWALLSGASAGLMQATKETCVLAFAAMAGGIMLTMLWVRWRDGAPAMPDPRPELRRGLRHGLVAVALALVVSVVLLSGFFAHIKGPLDSILAYGSYIGRAAADASRTDGAGLHAHPWHYYLHTLLYTKYAAGPWWSEGLIIGLALVGACVALACRDFPGANRHLLRFLAFYTMLSTIIYSIIPYKTPWCALSFLHGMILLAGVGAVAIVRALPNAPARLIACLLLAGATFQLGMQAYRGNYVYYADNRNPYVYAHSATDVMRLGQRLEDLAALHPDGHDMLVKILAPGSDYWPLPWYVRRFAHVGYWNNIPADPDAPVVIAAVALEDALDEKLQGDYLKEYYGLRPEVLLAVYIQSDLWDAFIRTRS